MTERMPTQEPVSEKLEAYALGALDPLEAAEVAAHLRECEHCRSELVRIEHAIGLIPLALADRARIEPPPSLRSRILGEIDRREEAPTGPRRRWSMSFVLAAAAAVLICLVSSAAYLGSALAAERATKEVLAQQLSQDEIMMEVVDSTITQRRYLRPARTGASAAHGKLFTRPDAKHAVLMVSHVPPPKEGEVYRVWIWENGKPVCPGEVPISDSGFGRIVFPLEPSAMPNIERVAVTVERKGEGEEVVVWQRQ